MPAQIIDAPTGADEETLHRAICEDCLWSGHAWPTNEMAANEQAIHNSALHPGETPQVVLMSRQDMERVRIVHTAALRWRPPTDERESMNIHPEARIMLRAVCNNELAGTGVGYSEFIAAAIVAHQRGDWSIAPKPAKGEPTDA